MPSDSENGIDSSRRRLLAVLGGSASVGLAGCSALFGDEGNGDDDTGNGDDDTGNGDDDTGNGETDTPESDRTEADKAQAAWERIAENPEPDAEDVRAEAHVEIEEAVRDAAIVIPFMHSVAERFWYDNVDVPKTGAMGTAHQLYHTTEVEGDDELNLIINTFNHVDPIESDDVYSSEVINQIYERFVEYPNGVADLSNMLLEEFEISEDGLTYTFHLTEGVQFHDDYGEMTADDVVYSWRRVAEAPRSVRQNFLISSSDGIGIEYEEDDDGNVEPDSLALEVVDDYTLEMQVQEPNPEVMDVLTYTAFAVMPEGLVGDIEGYDGDLDENEVRQQTTVGTGPFTLDELAIDEECRVTRFDDHREPANVESVHWAIIEDDEAAYTYAMEQNADIFGIPTQYYDQELIEEEEEDDRSRVSGTYGPHENDETTNYLRIPELSISYFGFNAAEVPKPVRQAIAHVTDHEELVTDVYAGRATEAYSFTPPGIWPTGTDGYEEFREAHPYSPNDTDLQAAQDVLEEAGYTADDPFELTLTTSTAETTQQAAELLRDKLAGNGVEINLEDAQFATLVERAQDGNVDMYSLGWSWSWESAAYGHFGFEPKNTDTSSEDMNGYYLNWHTELEEEA